MTTKHALSLVAELIMYPEISQFVRLLHKHNISTFLVTNAQFPDEIRNLDPVTQLYVSVDASTKESLKRIDLPLFKDFWQRFLDSLKALSEKRTVYRLTLVKAWNVDALKASADLISLGKPGFIKVKGVTYCGKSSASNLTMANVPWHEEVMRFVQELTDHPYEIACEHEHSNCFPFGHKEVRMCQGVMPGTVHLLGNAAQLPCSNAFISRVSLVLFWVGGGKHSMYISEKAKDASGHNSLLP
ncbi:LOW QUALITY PROTEIN: S-adenosyl-L-methionine-dependent tRNA 4-demethylwyosine synthase TYW1B [Guaruba guarouba]